MKLSARVKTLTGRVWLVFVSFFVLFLCSFIASAIILSGSAIYNAELTESETLIQGAEANISTSIETYKDLSRLVMLNANVVEFLRAEEADPGLSNDAKIGVMDVMNVTTNLDSVYIFRNDGEFMSTGRGIYNVDPDLMATDEWKNLILDRRGSAVIFINANDAIHKNNSMPIVTVARAIYDIYSQKLTGILLMNFSQNMFERINFDVKDSTLCIMSTDGEYLAGNEELCQYYSEDYSDEEITHEMVYKNFRRVMISRYVIPKMPIVILCCTEANYRQLPLSTLLAMMALVVAFVVGMLLAGYFISRDITKPIQEMTGAMERTKENHWMERLDVQMPNNEIGALADSYNSMIDYLNDLFNELIEKEKTVQKAEMRVLHEQIKPHFLYNSMETISYMALNAGAGDVHEALETLGSFYRNFLSKGDRIIPLAREVKIIQDYLAIQKLRYGDIIEDEYEISDEAKDWMIPKLILQPLVENSIYHGIRLTGEPGIIKVVAFVKDNELHLMVRDTGIGMSEEVIERLLAVEDVKVEQNAVDRLHGFGLKGTIDRVRYYCGKDDVVHIRSEIGEYAEIEFVIATNRGDEDV